MIRAKSLEDLVGRFFMKKNKRPGGQHSAIFIAARVNKYIPGAPYSVMRMDELVLRSVLSPTYEHVEPSDLLDQYDEVFEEAIVGLLRDRLVD